MAHRVIELMSYFQRRRLDHRTRSDRNERQNIAFKHQMKELTDAYMVWSYEQEHGPLPEQSQEVSSTYSVQVVNLYGNSHIFKAVIICTNTILETSRLEVAARPTDPSPGPALIRQGAMPTSPISPSVGISIKTLELYRCANFRCPQLSIQGFVKTISDLHLVCPLLLIV